MASYLVQDKFDLFFYELEEIPSVTVERNVIVLRNWRRMWAKAESNFRKETKFANSWTVNIKLRNEYG